MLNGAYWVKKLVIVSKSSKTINVYIRINTHNLFSIIGSFDLSRSNGIKTIDNGAFRHFYA